MKLRTWKYLLREAWRGMRTGRLMALASVSTVAVSLLVFGMFLALVVNLGQLVRQVESEVQIRAFLADDMQPDSAKALEQKIKSLEGVTVVHFVSRQEALERMRNSFGDRTGVLEAVEEMNPLPDSYEVQVDNPQRVGPVATAIAGMPGVKRVDYKQETVERLFRITSVIRWLGLALGISLVLACAVVISNTVRLSVFARRREVAIMKLVGATDWFIRWPFVLEGLFLGLGGGLLAIGLLTGAYWWAAGTASKLLPFLPLVELEEVVRQMAPGLLALGVAVGVLGSGVSVRRFLQV